MNVSSTPKVQYAYADGSANTVRVNSLTYPDGRILTYDYGSAGGTDDAMSRIAALIDDDASSTHLADYSYLGGALSPSPSGKGAGGEGLCVELDYTEPEIKYTLVGTAGVNDPDTGDIYRGLDRFGRIKDSYWYNYGTSTDADRIKYGYDRDSNRIWRENTVAPSSNFDELYAHDGINRLEDMQRGTLNAGKTAITDPTFGQCWSLDAVGNWQHFREDDDGSGWDLIQSREANKVNEITDVTETTGPSWVTPAYDAAGNMTTIPQPADPTQSFTATYDAWNRLVKVAAGGSTVVESAYDPLRREAVHKTYSGGVLDETRHHYFSPMWQVLEQRLGTSTDPHEQFVWGTRYIDGLVQRDRDTTGNGTLDERLYALQDGNWNVTSIANASGAVQERYAYTPYGTPDFMDASFGSHSSSSFDWQTLSSGYRWDDTTLEGYHVRNRRLIPQVGWLERDPLGYFDGMSLYNYVGSQPSTWVDPGGLGRNDLIADMLANDHGIPRPTYTPADQRFDEGMSMLDATTTFVDSIPASIAQGTLNGANAYVNNMLAMGPATQMIADSFGVKAPQVDFSSGVFLEEDPFWHEVSGQLVVAAAGVFAGQANVGGRVTAGARRCLGLLDRLPTPRVPGRQFDPKAGNVSLNQANENGGWTFDNWFRFWNDKAAFTAWDPPSGIPFFRRWNLSEVRILDPKGTPGYLDAKWHEGTHALIGRYLPQFKDLGRTPLIGGPTKFVEESLAYAVGRLRVGRIHAIPLVPINAWSSLNVLQRMELVAVTAYYVTQSE